MIFYRVYTRVLSTCPLCPLSECPLSEVCSGVDPLLKGCPSSEVNYQDSEQSPF